MTKKKPSPAFTGLRPFETDYAGCWRGHCLSRENAINAAMRHVVMDGYSKAAITDLRTGEVVARVKLSLDHKTATLIVVEPLRKIER